MMPKHDVEADKESVVFQKAAEPEWKEIVREDWTEHTKRGADESAPKTLRVDYFTETGDIARPVVSEWICLEHTGFVFSRAANWWMCRCAAPVPNRIQDALEYFDRRATAETRSILVGPDKQNKKYKRVYDYVLGPVPSPEDWIEPAVVDEWVDEEIPF
jgi:DNA repair protein RadD